MRKYILIVLLVVLALSTLAFSACKEESVDEEVKSFTVMYLAQGGGRVDGKGIQTVLKGEAAETVTAIADENYLFFGWSDGFKEAQRMDTNVTEDITVYAVFERKHFLVNYIAGENGSIEGEVKQNVFYRNLTSPVTAVPDEGYIFDCWSDGLETAERRDKIYENLSLTAYFTEIRKTFIYNYKFATDNCSEEEIELRFTTLEDTIFIVPEREHFAFCGWYLGDQQVSDETGKITVGAEIFESDTTELSAKWEATETFTYKILLVYVTAINGTFKTKEGEIIEVDFQMSDFDRKICEITTIQFQTYLNNLMEGLVNFEVDDYFTTIPLTSKMFRCTEHGGQDCYSVRPSDIAEVKPLIGNYNSLLAVIEFGEELVFQLSSVAGLGEKKEGTIYLDVSFIQYTCIYGSKEQLLDYSEQGWKTYLDSYVHELIHTIELQIIPHPMSFHEVSVYYHAQRIYNDWEIMREYLLGVATVEGERVGIPYDLWKQI